MGVLMEEHLLFERNANVKMASKKKALSVHTKALVYRIDKLFDTSFPEGYFIDFREYRVKAFSLESLKEIVSIVEFKLSKGLRRDFLFYSENIMVMTDNLTVSLTEYVITFYKRTFGINVYISYGKLKGNEFIYGLSDNEMKVYNGFFVGEAGRGFMRDSFILDWFFDKKELTHDEFYCKREKSNRRKILVGTGPWDASIAISECTDFLEGAKVSANAISAVSDVIGELAPNAVEHGKVNCLIDICYERSTSIDGQDLTNISIVIFNFSNKLLWTDLYDKVFVDNESITFKKDRIDKVRLAWQYHNEQFSNVYFKEDFYNLMAFQKISGRKGNRSDGGLGINTLIQNVQKYSTDDYCYVLSGNGALLMDRNITIPDDDDYISFNQEHRYVDRIPDENAVMQTKFYMPGVAYNLTFYFEEIE